MSELPSGWEWTTLGAIGEYLNGRGFRKHEWSTDGRPIIRIQNLTGSGSSFNYYDGAAEESYIARRGDLLISWAATLGAFVWEGPEAVVNQHIFKVRSFIDKRFHRYLVTSVLDELQRKAHGSGMVHVTRKVFDETPVGLPPLGEQSRIVAAIEEQLSRLDAAEAFLSAAEMRLRNLRRTAIDRSLDGAWDERTLGDIIRSLKNGVFVSRPGSLPPGVPIFRISAVRPLALNVGDIRYASVDPESVADYFVNPGDLLFTRYSGNPDYVGACAAVPPLPRRTLHPDKLIRVTLDREACLPEYVEIAFAASRVRAEVEKRLKTTAGQVGIAGSQLRSVPLPVPPLDDQARIAEEANAALDAIGALVDSSHTARRNGDALRRSILATAFRGELVPQLADDEPSSVLLDRIAAKRAAVPRSPRKRTEKASA